MAPDSLKQLISQGLAALQAGSQVAAGATAEIQQAAHDPRLKSALDQGNDTAKQWAARIDRALAEAGGAGDKQNPILEAHYQVSQKIRQQAPDDLTRDLGIIAAGQLALHYWIASFGTLAHLRRPGRPHPGPAGAANQLRRGQNCRPAAYAVSGAAAEQQLARTQRAA